MKQNSYLLYGVTAFYSAIIRQNLPKNLSIGIIQPCVVYSFYINQCGAWRGVPQPFADDRHFGIGFVGQAGPAVSGHVGSEFVWNAGLPSQFA